MNKAQIDAATLLLNLKCSNTQQPIAHGEIVKIHNWGVMTHNQVISYGYFQWDTFERNFSFVPHKGLNDTFGKEYINIESAYDLFRTSPAKLNSYELDKLKSLEG